MSDPNFDTMTAAEIKAYIEAQAVSSEEEQPSSEQEQPRDEQGRFVAAEPEVEAAAEPEAEPEQFYHREEIDNGFGGKEVFTGIGASPEEAVQDCLRQVVEAKGHATRKIRELSQQPAQVQPEPVQAPVDDATLLVRMQSEPTAAVRDILVREFGMTPAELKQKLEQANQVATAQAADAASREFVAATPDYYACEANGKKIIRWLEMKGTLATVESITEAYQDLKADGLLVSKPAEQAAPRAARSSGLSTRRSASAPVQKPVDTSKMTLEQLRELAGGYQNPY